MKVPRFPNGESMKIQKIAKSILNAVKETNADSDDDLRKLYKLSVEKIGRVDRMCYETLETIPGFTDWCDFRAKIIVRWSPRFESNDTTGMEVFLKNWNPSKELTELSVALENVLKSDQNDPC